MLSGDGTIHSKDLNHADAEARDSQSRLRHRKARNPLLDKMVGSGSGEPLEQNLEDIKMELEIDSESESIDEDTQRLIPTPLPKVDIKGLNHNNSVNKSPINLYENDKDESVWSISIQMFIPFLLAGFGMVAASLLLDVVQVIFI